MRDERAYWLGVQFTFSKLCHVDCRRERRRREIATRDLTLVRMIYSKLWKFETTSGTMSVPETLNHRRKSIRYSDKLRLIDSRINKFSMQFPNANRKRMLVVVPTTYSKKKVIIIIINEMKIK